MAPNESVHPTLNRKPLRNFIFHPGVQWPQIVRNGLLALFTSVGTGLAIVYLYQREFGDTAIYVMDHNSAFYPLDRRGLLTMLLPAIAAMSVTGILMGWLLTLGASRRIALPVYKVTQWARRVSEGDLHVRLGFRKGDGLDGLAETCNAALDTMRSSLGEIERMSQDEKIPEPVRHRLGEIVSRYRL